MQTEKKREAKESRRSQGLDSEEEDETLQDEELKAIQDEKLRKAKIDKQTKLIIHEHSTNLDGTISKTLDERMKQLDERAQGGAAAVKKK